MTPGTTITSTLCKRFYFTGSSKKEICKNFRWHNLGKAETNRKRSLIQRQQSTIITSSFQQGNHHQQPFMISIQSQQQQHRSFTTSSEHLNNSSSQNPSSNNSQKEAMEEMRSEMEEKTKVLLQKKLSLDDSDLWVDADHLLRYWSNIDSLDGGSIEYCIQILDKLSDLLPQNEGYFGSMLETDLLNKIMYRWKLQQQRIRNSSTISQSQQKQQRNISKHKRHLHNDRMQQSKLTPSIMTEKIEKYRWSSLVQPNGQTYDFILNVSSSYYGKSETNGLPFAEALLDKLIQVMEVTPSAAFAATSTNTESSSPKAIESLVDNRSFGLIINGCVQQFQPERAEKWLRRMNNLCYDNRRQEDWHTLLQPNNVIYTTIIDGFAKVGDGPRAQAILDEQLEDYTKHNNDAAQPDVWTFNAVLNAWSKTKKKSKRFRIHDLLKQMRDFHCIADEYTYAVIVKCCTIYDGPEKAMQVLKEFEAMMDEIDDDDNNNESEPSLNSTKRKRPTIVAYNTILQAYANTGKGQQAQELLQSLLMKQRQKQQQQQSSTSSSSSFVADGIAPDQQSFNTAIAAWSKSKDPDAPLHAEATLRLMKDYSIQPSIVTYSSLINCWANSNYKDSAERAEQILWEMQQQKHNHLKPNIVCYNAVLKAWANRARTSGDTEPLARMTSVFDDLLKQQHPSNRNNFNNDLKPTISTFKTILHGVVVSNAKNKLERAQVVISLMERFGLKPDKRDQRILKRLETAAAAGIGNSGRQQAKSPTKQ